MNQTITIASIIKNISEVEFFFNDIFKELKFSRKIYCKIYLAVSEAVNNAIVHGNKLNANKNVIIEFEEFEDKYNICIQDEGNGFDYKLLPDPRDPVNIKKEYGRGIFIMKQYADKVIFENNGAKINLIFNK